MSISRIGSSTLAAGAVWALAACGQASEQLAPRSVSLAEDFVVLGAPGYCADVDRTDLARDPKVILFGSCAALRDNAFVAGPSHPGLVTVAVTELDGVAPTVTALESFLSSETGRARLSRSGEAGRVNVLETHREDGILYLHARDTSPGLTPGALPDVWRAMMTIDGRLLSISLLSFANDPVSAETAFAILRTQCDRIRQANIG